jgi:hypothetical protein
MADLTVWCLLLDYNYKPNLGEPFPVSLSSDHTVHDLKIRLNQYPLLRSDMKASTNSIEIWRCKKLKLFAKDSFSLIKSQLHDIGFRSSEDSHVQHLGTAQRVTELELEDSKLLLAMIP